MTVPANFVFAVDLDGVCAEYYEGIRPLAAEWFGVEESELDPNVSYNLLEWGMPDAPGSYYDFHKWAVTQKDLFLKFEPVKGCAQALRQLSKEKIRIRIVTHRLFISYFHVPAILQTIKWLDSHGIPYWDLCFMGEKAQVAAHVYIDDTPDNIEKLLAAGRDVIIFGNTTNRQYERQPQYVESWEEVKELVLQKYAKWKKDIETASKPTPPLVPPPA